MRNDKKKSLISIIDVLHITQILPDDLNEWIREGKVRIKYNEKGEQLSWFSGNWTFSI